jgi:hypothetical protein
MLQFHTFAIKFHGGGDHKWHGWEKNYTAACSFTLYTHTHEHN